MVFRLLSSYPSATMAAGISIDLERASKGAGSHHNGSRAGPTFPLFRRKKSLLILVVLAFLALFTLFNNRAGSSFRWVKDSMRTNSGSAVPGLALPKGPLPNDFGLSLAAHEAALADGAIPTMDTPSKPPSAGTGQDLKDKKPEGQIGTDAFRKLAAAQGYSDKEIDKLAMQHGVVVLGSPPSPAENLLLFFQALKGADFQVGSAWKKELMPTTEADFVKSLGKLEGVDKADVQLFQTDRTGWSAKHVAQHPLVVFSKSYCPYSKKAKELLRSMGAHFTLFEVDLRPDAHELQKALADIGGHHTFPAVFAKGKLLGGSDDLENLSRLKVLPGILKGAGAM